MGILFLSFYQKVTLSHKISCPKVIEFREVGDYIQKL